MYNLNRKFFFLLVGACVLFSSCSQNPLAGSTIQPTNVPDLENTQPAIQSTSFSDKDIQGTVSIYHSWNEDKRSALDDILREFNKKYPDVYFDITFIPADELQDLFASEVTQDRGPTLLLGPAEWGPALFDASLIKDLDLFFDPAMLDDLNSPALEASVYNGKLASLPYSIHGIVLYRNKDIMTITADNFDELVMLAQAATQGEIAGAILERSFYYSGGHLLGVGGKLMDENAFPSFNTPEGETWLQLLQNFELVGKTSFFSDEGLEEFKAGRVGWIIDGSWNLVELAEAIGAEKLAVDPWPELDAGRLSGFVQSDNLFLSATAEDDALEAARVFMEYFLNQTAQAHLAEVNFIPAALFVDMPDTDFSPIIAQAMTAMAKGVAYPNVPVMDLYSLHLDLAIKAYLESGLQASKALGQAYEAILADMAAQNPTPTP